MGQMHGGVWCVHTISGDGLDSQPDEAAEQCLHVVQGPR